MKSIIFALSLTTLLLSGCNMVPQHVEDYHAENFQDLTLSPHPVDIPSADLKFFNYKW